MQNRRAFTLVELLIVVAIMAMLLSILVPSLWQVRERASRVICGGNLHQWHLVLLTYAADNRDRLPRPYSNAYLWSLNYPDCIEGKNNANPKKDFGFLIYPYLRKGNLGQCPNNKTWLKEADFRLWAQLAKVHQPWATAWDGKPYSEPYRDGHYSSQYMFIMDSSYFHNEGGDRGPGWDPRTVADKTSDPGGLLVSMDLTLLSAYPGYWPRMINHVRPGRVPNYYWEANEARKQIYGSNALYLAGNVVWVDGTELSYGVVPWKMWLPVGMYLLPEPKVYKSR